MFKVGRTGVSGEDVLRRFVPGGRGRCGFLGVFGGGGRGAHRGVRNAALARWELYVGADGGAEPSFASAAATGTSLPIRHALADGSYRLVLRRRNSFGVVSENRESTLVTIVDGELEGTRPGALRDVTAVARGSWLVVRGRYEAEGVAATPARWDVSVTWPVGEESTESVSDGGELLLSNGVGEFEAVIEMGGVIEGTATVEAWASVADGVLAGPVTEVEVSVPGEEETVSGEAWLGQGGPAFR